MDYSVAIRLAALRAVEKPDEDANIRYLCREYSKLFHTPLHVVEELPVEDVMQAYYENLYGDMSPPDREHELLELMETHESREAKERAKDIEQAELLNFAKATERAEAIKAAKKAAEKAAKAAKLTAPIPLPPDIEMNFE